MVTETGDSVRRLENRVDRLARELALQLRERGSIVVGPNELSDVDEWRSAARRAGRLIGWHVRTGTTPGGGAWVASLDYKPTAEQLADAVRALDELASSDGHRPASKHLRVVR